MCILISSFTRNLSLGRLTVFLTIVCGFIYGPHFIRAELIHQDAWDNTGGLTPAESRLDDASYDAIVRLNRHTFHGNVQSSGRGLTADHWIVLYCADWHEPCQALLPSFVESGTFWQDHFNSGRLLTSYVRFARVDCAVDKPICNAEGVEVYPTMVHYTQGRPVAQWSSIGRHDQVRLERWLERVLLVGPPASPPLFTRSPPICDAVTPVSEKAAAHAASISLTTITNARTCGLASISFATLASRVTLSEYVATLAVVFGVAFLNFWVIWQQVDDASWEKEELASKP